MGLSPFWPSVDINVINASFPFRNVLVGWRIVRNETFFARQDRPAISELNIMGGGSTDTGEFGGINNFAGR